MAFKRAKVDQILFHQCNVEGEDTKEVIKGAVEVTLQHQ